MERITQKMLERQVERINAITNSPTESWTRIDGKSRSNIGNYHLDGAYGGWALHRMCNESGGVEDVSRIGHVPKRELYNFMQAYIAGLEA